jgi:hypothetical protein
MEINPLSMLSAMITPAVLILASGSLISPTSQRLGIVMNRIRQIAERFKDFSMDEKVSQEEQESFYRLLNQSTQSAELLHKALRGLYLAVIFFVATSVSIGFLDITSSPIYWPSIWFGLSGAATLLYSAFLLIMETKIAFRSVYLETEFLLQLQKQYAPKDISKTNWFKNRSKFFKKALPGGS